MAQAPPPGMYPGYAAPAPVVEVPNAILFVENIPEDTPQSAVEVSRL